MKAFKASSGNEAVGWKCEHCQHTIEVGQIVLAMDNKHAPFGRRVTYAHKQCVIRLLNKAGLEDDETRFEKLRDEMVVTGMAFPHT